MKLIVIVQLCLAFFCLNATTNSFQSATFCPETRRLIDSNDIIIFSFDQASVYGQIVEIPILIISDEVINALDFSFTLNTENVEFESIVDHTDGLQYAAFFNPNDLKLRFTSNSFSSYPKFPVKVISVRVRVLTGTLYRSDFFMMTGYLNGDPCSFEMQGKVFEIAVSNKEIITDELIMSPNPATDVLYFQGTEGGTLDMFDMQGHEMMRSIPVLPGQVNQIDVSPFPRGQYTLRLQTAEGTIKTQKLILQ